MKKNIKARLEGKNVIDAWNVAPRARATMQDALFLMDVLKRVNEKDRNFWEKIMEVKP